MAYGVLDSPLPGLTVSPTGERCCGMRGSFMGMLGDDSTVFDTTPTYDTGSLIDPGLAPIDLSTLPPNVISPSLESMYPPTVGTEFTSNGDGTYTNIQTGQSVSYDTAAAVTQATTGSATANLQTVATGQGSNVTIVDPTTGHSSTVATNNLSTAAQALNAAGQLINAAGKLTSQGQALLNAGNLYNPVPASSGFNFSGAMSSLTSWMMAQTLFSGIPNVGVVGLGLLAIGVGLNFMSSRPKRRRR